MVADFKNEDYGKACIIEEKMVGMTRFELATF